MYWLSELSGRVSVIRGAAAGWGELCMLMFDWSDLLTPPPPPPQKVTLDSMSNAYTYVICILSTSLTSVFNYSLSAAADLGIYLYGTTCLENGS